ncbi:MAG: DUF2892 domain-containing protein, partial [Christiangramia sp.]
MKRNMGTKDQMIRLFIAALILVLFWQQVIQGALGYALLAIAVILVLTSFIGVCPLYSIFGIQTGKSKL